MDQILAALLCRAQLHGAVIDRAPPRHSSESWNPAFCGTSEELDPSFRWDDDKSEHP
jgi:hypothetical protein